MKTKIKTKLKLSAYLTLALIIGVLALGGVSRASSGSFWEGVQERVSQLVAGKVEAPQPSEDLIGAVSGPYLPNPYLVNDKITYVAVQTAIDASTTVFAITPPESFQKSTSTGGVAVRTAGGIGWTVNTTTVDFAGITVTGAATTTLVYSCGASAGASTAPSVVLLTGTMNTSTTGYFENNLTAALGGSVDGGTVAKITLTPTYPYFVCKVTPHVAEGVTGSTNTYEAQITVRMSRTR